MAILALAGKISSGKDTVGRIIQYLTSEYKDKYDFVEWKDRVENYGSNTHSPFEIKKFADKLKDIVCLLINCNREQLEDREFKEKELGEEWFKTVWWIKSNYNKLEAFYSKEEAEEFLFHWKENYLQEVYIALEDTMLTPRLLLQLLGTECGRNIIHPNIWVNALMCHYIKSDDKLIRTTEDLLEEWEEGKYPNWIITDMRFPNEMKAVKDRGGITIRVNRLNIKTITDGDITIKYIPIPNVDYKEHESETTLDNSTFDYEINNFGTIEELIEQVKEILIKENII